MIFNDRKSKKTFVYTEYVRVKKFYSENHGRKRF